MRVLLLAAGLCLASAAVQAQPAARSDVHAHVTTSLLYRPEAEPRISPLVTHPMVPAFSELAPYPASVRYFPPRRAYRPHIEVIERTYVVVEDSLPVQLPHTVVTPPPRGRKK